MGNWANENHFGPRVETNRYVTMLVVRYFAERMLCAVGRLPYALRWTRVGAPCRMDAACWAHSAFCEGPRGKHKLHSMQENYLSFYSDIGRWQHREDR